MLAAHMLNEGFVILHKGFLYFYKVINLLSNTFGFN